MPITKVRGVAINYELLGDRGPWVALQPGGRRGLVGVKPLGQKIAEAGNRVLVYDRRNCGASDISLHGGNSENEVWADDLHELLQDLDAVPGVCRRQLVGLPAGSAGGFAPPRRCARAPVVAVNRRRFCRRTPGAELLHSVHRSGATRWHGSGLPHRAFR